MKVVKQLIGIVVLFSSASVMAEEMALEKVLQRVVDNSLAIKVADLKLERSGLEKNKLESMLGWQLGGQSSFSHDTGFGSIPQNTLRLNSNLNRMLSDGSIIGASAGYSFTDSETVLFPGFPDPSHDATVDLSYRRPLLKGSGLPAYKEGRKLAELSEKLNSFNQNMIREQLATQTVETYFGLISTQTQIENTKKGIKRAQRMLQYNRKNQELGLSERKDILQVNAQIRAREAELESLNIQRQRLIVALNQLMNRNPDKKITAVRDKSFANTDVTFDVLYDAGLGWSPTIKLYETQIEMAETQISMSRDQLKDTLDGFATVGGRAKYGDTTTGSTVNEQDYAFSVGVEFQKSLDRRDVNAEISQAKIDRLVAQQEIENIKRNLKFNIASLLQEIESTGATINAMQVRYDQEKQKLDEGVERYRRGRANTLELITFENDISLAEFMLEQQKIELSKKYAKLEVVSGKIWQRVVPLQSNKE